ncbi:hypothetical protein Bca52824_068779 [Brassica carinata]|uniref:Phytocyanin domain-containing protein n=1 Tax=Brassica carinata TaxID=52824 RepID=A0A8X7Q399_BRACI|nr:hypothetical protein Bca52824_068779 [Brassica carinata]
MATTTRMFCFVLVMVLMGCCCSAKIYKVGDSKGWTAKKGSYYEWARRKEFQVGDSLMFEYDGSVNDVTQVSSRLEYRFCNSLSPKAVYNTGHDVVTLTEPGYHFFISSNHSQCIADRNFVVFVVHDHPMIPPPPPPRKILPFEKITRSVTPANGGFLKIVICIPSGVRRNSFMWETIFFSTTTTKSMAS